MEAGDAAVKVLDQLHDACIDLARIAEHLESEESRKD